LRNQGLRTVVNTREESTSSRAMALAVGLRYYYIPVEDWSVPQPHQIEEFLGILDDSEHHAVLIHCWGGAGRTGIFVSCYRMARLGMEVEAAIQLSDQETPHLVMSELQRDWLRQFSRSHRRR
jgi:insecticidal toxin complex protein TccC